MRKARAATLPRSAVIGAANDEWSPSTPRQGGTLITPTSYLDSLWRADPQSRVAGDPPSLPGLSRDDDTLPPVTESDDESDWVTDDEYPDPCPSRGGGAHPGDLPNPVLRAWHCARCTWLVGESRVDWGDKVE